MAQGLDIKKFSKFMSFEENAKLLFADISKRTETNGVERILTPEEREKIIENIWEAGKANDLARLKKMYDLTMFLLMDVQTAFLNYTIGKSVLIGLLMAISVRGQTDKNDEYLNQYSLFYVPPPEKYPEGLLQTNPYLEKAFLTMILRVRLYNHARYKIKYLNEELAKIDFLNQNDRKRFEEYENDMADFLNFKGVFEIFQGIKDLSEKGLMQTINIPVPNFLEALRDMKSAVELNDVEKRFVKMEVEDMLTKPNY